MQQRRLTIVMIAVSLTCLTAGEFFQSSVAYALSLPPTKGPEVPTGDPPPPLPPNRPDDCEDNHGIAHIDAVLCIGAGDPGQPDFEDEYAYVPPAPSCNQPGSGPVLGLESYLRSYGGRRGLEVGRSRSIQALQQVYTDRGEEVYEATDLVIPGVGFDYAHKRTFRNQDTTNRAQGTNWMHQYQERIVLQRAMGFANETFPPPFRAWVRAGDYPGDNGRWQAYRDHIDGPDSLYFNFMYTSPPSNTSVSQVFFPQNDVFTRLQLFDSGRIIEAGNGKDIRDDFAVLYSRGGWKRTYKNIKSLPGVSISGEIPRNWGLIELYLTEIEDANGNTMQFEYASVGTGGTNGSKLRLKKVIDTLGREIIYRYYSSSEVFAKRYRIKEIEDFLGRTVEYDYDAEGNLISVMAPSVDDITVTNNTFADHPPSILTDRKTETYTYSDLDPNGVPYTNKRQRHNLTGVYRGNENDDRHGVAPDDTPALSWTYYCNDRVKTHTIGSGVVNGDDWEAGGTFSYTYSTSFTTQDYDPKMEEPAEFRTIETNPRGDETRYYYTEKNAGSLARREQLIHDPATGNLQRLITRHRYSGVQKLDTFTQHPDGSITLKEYESRGNMYTSQANMTRRVEIPAGAVDVPGVIVNGVYVPGVYQVPEGSDQQILDYRYAYDPVYNKPWVEVGPRGTQGVVATDPHVAIKPGDEALFKSIEIFLNLPPDLDILYDSLNDPAYSPPNGGTSSLGRYKKEWVYEYQEGNGDLAALANHMGLAVSTLQSAINHAEGQRERILGFTSPQPSMLGLGDQNDDGITNRLGNSTVKIIMPTVTLPDATTQALVTKTQHDDLGRVIVAIDANDNETHYAYGTNTAAAIGSGTVFDEVNTEYDLGFLESVTVDPTGLNLTTTYVRNALGQVLKSTDARGNTTTTKYNELGQPIRTRAYQGDPDDGSGTAVLMAESFSIYDANNNVIASYVTDIKTDDSGGVASYTYDATTGNGTLPIAASPFSGVVPTPSGVVTSQPAGITSASPAGLIGSRTEYNISNQPIRQHVEATNPAGGGTVWLKSDTRYDAMDRPVWMRSNLGFISTTLYDQRGLAFQTTSAVGTPQETTITNYYDISGNLVATVDAEHEMGQGEDKTATLNVGHSIHQAQVIGLATSVDGQGLDFVSHTGDVTRMYYDGFNRLKRSVDAIGNETVNIYDPASNIVQTAYRGPIGGTSPIDNSGTGNVLLSLTRMDHDELNRNYRTDRLVGAPNGIALASGRSIVLADDDTYFLGDTAPAEFAGDYQSDGGWISGETVFDLNGNTLESYDDNGDMTVMVYDKANRPTTVTDPVGNVSVTTYDDNSNVTQVTHTDFNQSVGGNETVQAFFTYDALNRKTRAKADPGDGDIIDYYGYDSRSNPTVHFDARGNISRSFFDAAGRNMASVQELTVNGTGSTAIDSTQGGGDGRILTRSFYDPDSRLIAQIDDNNNRTTYEYDALGRKTKTIFGQYDNADGVAVSAGEATLYGVTAGGNLADQQDTPTEKTWAYDKDSNVTTHVDQNGTTHSFTYDGGHRRTQVDIAFVAGNPHNLAGTTQQQFQYDGLGRQTYALDNNGAGGDVINRWKYDLISRTLEESTKIGSFAERFQSWEYDGSLADSGSGTPSAQLYADGRRIKYAYDANDRLKSITDDLVGASPIVEYKYIGPGSRTKSVERANGVDIVIDYDDIRRRTGITDATTGGGATTLSGFEYAYDGEHQPRFERNLTHGGESDYYTFDSAGRVRQYARGPISLTGASLSATTLPGVTQSRVFKMDGVNNWDQTLTLKDNAISVEDREHTNFNEVHTAPDTTGVTLPGGELTYDDQGNLLRRDYPVGSGRRSVTYHWDGLNRLREVRLAASPQTTLVEYLHATGNQRVAKTVSDGGVPSDNSLNGTTHFYYAGWKLCDEYDIGSTRAGLFERDKFQYVWGPRHDDELVCRDDRRDTTVADLNDGFPGGGVQISGGRQYQHHNRGWNIRAVTDEAGTVLERYLYDPHGKPTVLNAAGTTVLASTQIEQDYGYTNQRYDRETELWYFKHRYLDDGLGRFISRDPAGYVDGMNLYTAYFVLTGTDPLGLDRKNEEEDRMARLIREMDKKADRGESGTRGGSIARGEQNDAVDAGETFIEAVPAVAGATAQAINEEYNPLENPVNAVNYAPGGKAVTAGVKHLPEIATGAAVLARRLWNRVRRSPADEAAETAAKKTDNLGKEAAGEAVTDAQHGIPDDRADHIFRDADGHVPDTPENRQLLQGVANNPETTLGVDQHGNTWSAQTLDDGTQGWTQTRNGNIINGGVNVEPRTFDPDTGLSASPSP